MSHRISLKEDKTQFAGRVDRDRNLIRDVLVCGFRSGNGRRYSERALREAVDKYSGLRVFIDHNANDHSDGRSIRDRFGTLVNPRFDRTGIRADLKYNPHHPDAERILFYAANAEPGVGLSHVASGRGERQGDGSVVVTEISAVSSADVVESPATARTFYEARAAAPAGGTPAEERRRVLKEASIQRRADRAAAKLLRDIEIREHDEREDRRQVAAATLKEQRSVGTVAAAKGVAAAIFAPPPPAGSAAARAFLAGYDSDRDARPFHICG